MPESQEIEVDKRRATIDQELERERGGGFTRQIALTTAILAVFAAIAALKAGGSANEALIRKTEATRLQTAASDEWNYYQAKGIKLAVADAAASTWRAAGKSSPTKFTESVQRYGAEQQEIKRKAERLERERDRKSTEGDELMHLHHGFANAVALFQVSIALGALAALTRLRPVWLGSLALGAAGILLFGSQLLG